MHIDVLGIFMLVRVPVIFKWGVSYVTHDGTPHGALRVASVRHSLQVFRAPRVARDARVAAQRARDVGLPRQVPFHQTAVPNGLPDVGASSESRTRNILIPRAACRPLCISLQVLAWLLGAFAIHAFEYAWVPSIGTAIGDAYEARA
jgi:hypothetical protein